MRLNFFRLKMKFIAAILAVSSLCAGVFGNAPEPAGRPVLPSNFGEGTQGERDAFNAAAEYLDSLGISYSRRSLGESARGHSFSEVLTAVVPGLSADRFILSSPMESGGYSTTLLLEAASRLAADTPMHTVELNFLGGERGETPFHPYGSRLAAADVENSSRAFALYIDAREVPETWRLGIGGKGVITPFPLIRGLLKVMENTGIPHRIRAADIHLARLGLQDDAGPLSVWLEAGIPGIALEGSGTMPLSAREGRIDRMVRAVLELDKSIERIPADWENTYAYIRPFEAVPGIFVGELTYAAGLLILSALLLIIVLAQSRRVRLNFRRFAPFWWTLPLLFFMVFLFLFLVVLFIEGTGLLADFPTLWTYAPGIFVFFKITLAVSISLIFILIARGLPLPRTPNFYSYSAVITAGVFTLVSSALDITLTSYAIWANLALLLFTVSRNLRLKSFFLILGLLPYAAWLGVILSQPYTAVLEFLLLSRIAGSLVLTLILLPFVLGITSLNYLQSRKNPVRSRFISHTVILICSLSAVVTLFWILRLTPYGPENPQPVTLEDRIDTVRGERRLLLSSPGPVGRAELLLEGSAYPLEDIGRRAEIRTPLNRTPLEIRGDSRGFLGRRTIGVLITGEADPEQLNLQLRSAESFTIHDADMPFEIASSGAAAEIFVGRNPPLPFEFEFTVNGEAELILSVRGVWNDPEDPPGVNRDGLWVSTRRIVYAESAL